ncbi:MAG: gliding motility-associated C-terminal domain-containing protein [Bacteroidia bacterium]|nr:gliding motility-associated C-terminal domain-containing protein [Bacteroidia bacterium]
MYSRILSIALGLFHLSVFGQYTLTPFVMNSAGQATQMVIGTLSLQYADNIGETFVSTIGNSSSNIVTQGFLQPENSPLPFISYTITNVSCLDKRDGSINIEIKNTKPEYTISTVWVPHEICPSTSCFHIDSLSGGTFSVYVSVNTGFSVYLLSSSFTIQENQGPCILKIFNGISFSGNNPFLFIENIEQYPDNTVSIYSRWGNHIKTINGYNNTTKKWPSESDQRPMPGTYYVILEAQKLPKPIKAWIEVLE